MLYVLDNGVGGLVYRTSEGNFGVTNSRPQGSQVVASGSGIVLADWGANELKLNPTTVARPAVESDDLGADLYVVSHDGKKFAYEVRPTSPRG